MPRKSLTKVYEKRNTQRVAKQEAEAGRPKPNCCELCNSWGKVVFDHCHTYGHFRGWICARCNKVLGFVQDNPTLLYKMIDYLHRNGST